MLPVAEEFTPAAEALPYPWNSPTARYFQLRAMDDEVGIVRCPICRHFLVARQGRDGPYFHCGCAPRRAVTPSHAPASPLGGFADEPLAKPQSGDTAAGRAVAADAGH